MANKTGIVIGLAAIGAGIAFLVTRARAVPPPEGYSCPYCDEVFVTYEELVAHVQSYHPGQRIPLDIEWK